MCFNCLQQFTVFNGRIPTSSNVVAQAIGLNFADVFSVLGVANGFLFGKQQQFLVDLFLVRRLQPYAVNTKKRLVKSPKIYIRDSGLLHALLGIANVDELFGHPVVGNSWEGFVIENLLSVTSERTVGGFYRTSGGAEIDLVLERPGGEKWAIEIKRGKAPKVSRGFYSALEDLEPDEAFVVHSGDEEYPVSEGVRAIPLRRLQERLLVSNN